MGSCKFKVRKGDYSNTLNIISNLFPSRDDHIILGDDKYQRWIKSNGYVVNPHFQNADLLTSIHYIGCYVSSKQQYIEQYIDIVSPLSSDNLLYVILDKDLKKVLVSREDLIKELKIIEDFSSYSSLDDFLRDIKNKTGITYQIGYAERLSLPKEIIIPKILETSLRQVAENKKNEFLFSLPWGGYKRNSRDRYGI